MSELTQVLSRITSINGFFRPWLEAEAGLQELVKLEVSAKQFEDRTLAAQKLLLAAKEEHLKLSADIELKKRTATADHERVCATRAKGLQATTVLYAEREQALVAAYAAKEAEISKRVDTFQAALEELRKEHEELVAEVNRLRAVRDSLKSQLAGGATGDA